MTFEELDYKIVGWAAKRGILKNSTPKDQFVKTIEEVGEIAHRKGEMKDGIFVKDE